MCDCKRSNEKIDDKHTTNCIIINENVSIRTNVSLDPKINENVQLNVVKPTVKQHVAAIEALDLQKNS